MKVTSVIILPFLFLQTLSNKTIDNNQSLQTHNIYSNESFITEQPIFHLCYQKNYRVDKLDSDMIYTLYIKKDTGKLITKDKLCAMEIKKTDNPQFKYNVSFLGIYRDTCKKIKGFNIICNQDSNCTKAVFCSEIFTNKSIKRFDLMPVNLNLKNSTYDKDIKKWIYNNGKQKCTFSNKTTCIQIKDKLSNSNSVISDAMVILILFFFYYSLLTAA